MLRPRDGYFLFNVAKKIACRIVMFLPRNVDLNQLAELSMSAQPPWSLEGRSLWDQEETQNGGSWARKKLLKLRSLAQRFIIKQDGREMWKFHGNKYSAAAVWREIRPKKEKVAWHRLIWSPFVMPKHAVIAWMAILNRLPTKDRLKSWGLVMEDECPLCKHEQETRNHLFFECLLQNHMEDDPAAVWP